MKFYARSAAETKLLAGKLAREALVAARRLRKALVISLEGNLGAGKTTFTQGFARGLGIKARILSPTFVLVRKFFIPRSSRSKTHPSEHFFYHIDCYRLRKPKELLDLGWREALRDPGSIVLVEWGDKIRGILPGDFLRIVFGVRGKKEREISIVAIPRKRKTKSAKRKTTTENSK